MMVVGVHVVPIDSRKELGRDCRHVACAHDKLPDLREAVVKVETVIMALLNHAEGFGSHLAEAILYSLLVSHRLFSVSRRARMNV